MMTGLLQAKWTWHNCLHVMICRFTVLFVLLIVYETGIEILELTTIKGDTTPLYFSVSMMSIVPGYST